MDLSSFIKAFLLINVATSLGFSASFSGASQGYQYHDFYISGLNAGSIMSMSEVKSVNCGLTAEERRMISDSRHIVRAGLLFNLRSDWKNLDFHEITRLIAHENRLDIWQAKAAFNRLSTHLYAHHQSKTSVPDLFVPQTMLLAKLCLFYKHLYHIQGIEKNELLNSIERYLGYAQELNSQTVTTDIIKERINGNLMAYQGRLQWLRLEHQYDREGELSRADYYLSQADAIKKIYALYEESWAKSRLKKCLLEIIKIVEHTKVAPTGNYLDSIIDLYLRPLRDRIHQSNRKPINDPQTYEGLPGSLPMPSRDELDFIRSIKSTDSGDAVVGLNTASAPSPQGSSSPFGNASDITNTQLDDTGPVSGSNRQSNAVSSTNGFINRLNSFDGSTVGPHPILSIIPIEYQQPMLTYFDEDQSIRQIVTQFPGLTTSRIRTFKGEIYSVISNLETGTLLETYPAVRALLPEIAQEIITLGHQENPKIDIHTIARQYSLPYHQVEAILKEARRKLIKSRSRDDADTNPSPKNGASKSKRSK